MGKKVFVDLSHPFSAEIPAGAYFDKQSLIMHILWQRAVSLLKRLRALCTPAHMLMLPAM